MFLSVRLFNAVDVRLLHLTIICLQQAYNSICCRRLSGSYPFSAASSPSTPTAVTTASSSTTAGVSIPINRARVHGKVYPTMYHLGISRHPLVLSFLGIPSKCAVWKKKCCQHALFAFLYVFSNFYYPQKNIEFMRRVLIDDIRLYGVFHGLVRYMRCISTSLISLIL